MLSTLNRRSFLTGLGCTAAASPFLTPVTFASGTGENRLVVIILRGGMDGLDALRPYGDANFKSLKGRADQAKVTEQQDLDGFFALHPSLTGLMPLWKAGELGFAHAVSTPYRDKRSHFDGQDLLEAGGADLDGNIRDGWLNRMLQNYPGLQSETAYAVGRGDMFLMKGTAPVANWSPDAGLYGLTPQGLSLAGMLMEGDPLFEAAFSEAVSLSGESMGAMDVSNESGEMVMSAMRQSARDAAKGGGHVQIAEFAASKLKEASRIAAFSLNGWDTHANQSRTLAQPLTRLAEVILSLRSGVGEDVWGKTAVIAMTEFGRTARLNGNGGSDHGTGGLMVMSGGALRGGRVWSDWPGLGEADLYQKRDLMPTRDVRAYTGWLMRGLFGFDSGFIESTIFPGLDMGANPKLIT
ncbi:DUF1501 domain-containing protein [Lentibacter sp. XHP0401]|uniref:DUF1501 domain-containing protein n=1 Tax=Lentibacter sp. XHP0401 TaxID=2984334 RepID=UPI0021E7DC38|nr:DUF1501 domain-containing protein [Lentibacter sp. XHP0401]MCV2893557.1 DUF1501 domain-containing protein [Lentibacter sp. XHP0401]